MAYVKLANGKTFSVSGEQTILDAALQQDIFLEYSCRTGRCGVCKAIVLEGETQTIRPEESITPEDIANSAVLTCCRTALTDVSLDAEDLGVLVDYPAKTIPCRISSLTKLTDFVIEVVLRFPPGQAVRFLPGQYVDVIGKAGVRRSYSIANSPRQDGCIALYVKKLESGVMSQYWFNEARENDLLRLEGPLGTFFFREDPPNTVVFLATGTGIAPVKALLEYLDVNPEKVDGRRILVLWGNRRTEDFFWKPDFANIDVGFTAVLSQGGHNWSGASGYVQDALFEVEGEFDVKKAIVYACGSEAMILAAREMLCKFGLPVSRFYSDAFVSSN